jgi:hypothetical protein
MSEQAVTAGCQCGAVRYRLTAPPSEVVHCHCSICRRAHGALFATAGVYDKKAVHIDDAKATLEAYESSPGNKRLFCSSCGGQLFLTVGDWQNTMFVVLGTLDQGQHPGHERTVEKHIFWDSKVAWYDPEDDLPKMTGYGS